MRKLPINLDELAFVLHRGEELDMECFLDLDTGEIHYIPTDNDVLQSMFKQLTIPELVSITSLAERLFTDISHLLYIPDNFKDVVFELMNQFSNHSSLPEVTRERLLQAIHHKGGFEKFHKVLQEFPGLLTRFVEFRDSFFLEKAKEWLEGHEIVPVDLRRKGTYN